MRLLPWLVLVVACSNSPPPPKTVANQSTTPAVAPPPELSRGLAFHVVDDGSRYMERWLVHVGIDGKDGHATDPLAINAGVVVEVDRWSDDAGAMHQDYYLVARDREKLERYIETTMSKDPSFALPADRVLGYERVSVGSASVMWRTYLLEKQASFDGSYVASASKSFDPSTGRPQVLLDFDAAGVKAFAELTGRIVGRKLAITFKGVVQSAPIINSPIREGRAAIAMGGGDPVQQDKDADELVAALQTTK